LPLLQMLACQIGWSKECGAYLSDPGGIVANAGVFMDNFIATNSNWGSFQAGYANVSPDTTSQLLNWASGQQYNFLSTYTTTTPPICDEPGC